MNIINLTQHEATPDQMAAGVTDMQKQEREALSDALTFDKLPSSDEIRDRAEWIAELAVHNGLGGDYGDDPHPDQAMIGGAPWLMGPLCDALRQRGIDPVFAFSVRETQESHQTDGSVRKVNVFRHTGFVRAC